MKCEGCEHACGVCDKGEYEIAPVNDFPGLAGCVACKKCGGGDILTRWIARNKLIDSSSSKRVENEFVRCSEYSYYFKLTAAKEHLHRHCRNCQYDWREDIKTGDTP